MNSKWTMTLILKKELTTVFICDFDIHAFLGCRDVNSSFLTCNLLSGSYWKHHVSSPVIIFDKKLFVNWLERSEHINAPKNRNTHLISTTSLTQLMLIWWNHNWCKFKHAQTCLSYEQVTRLTSSHTIKSFLEPHSHTMYLLILLCWVSYCLSHTMNQFLPVKEVL
jgi:hypothetical protein